MLACYSLGLYGTGPPNLKTSTKLSRSTADILDSTYTYLFSKLDPAEIILKLAPILERFEPDYLPTANGYDKVPHLKMAKESSGSFSSYVEEHNMMVERPKAYILQTAKDRLKLERRFLRYFKNLSHASGKKNHTKEGQQTQHSPQRKEGQEAKSVPKCYTEEATFSLLAQFMYLLGAAFFVLTISSARSLLKKGSKWLTETQRSKKRQRPCKRKKQGGHSRPWSRSKYRHHHSKP